MLWKTFEGRGPTGTTNCARTMHGAKSPASFNWITYAPNPSHIRIFVYSQGTRVPARARIDLPTFTSCPDWNQVFVPLVSDYNITETHSTLRVMQKSLHSMSKSHYDWWSVSLGVEPALGLMSRFFYFLFFNVAVLSLWSVLSDERTGL
jgi:hypothetical protein